MEIIICNVGVEGIEEDYSEHEDAVIGILGDVCRMIDELGIAKLLVVFSSWDSRFEKVDFMYDFTSIASELEPLSQFLKGRNGEFILHFYELDRRIIFQFVKGDLSFKVSDSMSDEVLYRRTLDSYNFYEKIEEMISVFKIILIRHFPLAYQIFKEDRYLFSDWA